LGGKEILWGKRNFGDCKRIFEQAVVEALVRRAQASKLTNILFHLFMYDYIQFFKFLVRFSIGKQT
jgi:hypothetical protein